MGRFASTVAYYESARAPYGAAFFTAAAKKLELDRSQRLLDVGAGPGILAIGFKPYCREVVGVDPEPGMVEAARAAADRADVAITFIEGRFEDVAAKPRRVRSCDHRPRDPLARSRARSSGARSRRRAAGKDSGVRARPASQTAAIAGSTPSTRCAIAGGTIGQPMTSTRSSPADRSFRARRSALKGLMPFPSNALRTACCRCRPRRRSGLATRFRP